LTFQLPPVPSEIRQSWRRCIDTSLTSPDDIHSWQTAPAVRHANYLVQPRSVIVLALLLQSTA
jgi:hypothetical protein